MLNSRVFDTNGDGTISKDEFKRCMVNFGEKFSDEDVDEMVAAAYIDRSGTIDYHEFVSMMTSYQAGEPLAFTRIPWPIWPWYQ